MKYGKAMGIIAIVNCFCVHSLRSTAATNALEHAVQNDEYRASPDCCKVFQEKQL
jgi:hypothetical protein